VNNGDEVESKASRAPKAPQATNVVVIR